MPERRSSWCGCEGYSSRLLSEMRGGLTIPEPSGSSSAGCWLASCYTWCYPTFAFRPKSLAARLYCSSICALIYASFSASDSPKILETSSGSYSNRLFSLLNVTLNTRFKTGGDCISSYSYWDFSWPFSATLQILHNQISGLCFERKPQPLLRQIILACSQLGCMQVNFYYMCSAPWQVSDSSLPIF